MKLELQFREEEKDGMMMEMPDQTFKEKYGSNSAVSSLAVLVEGEAGSQKIRVIRDGTHKTRMNHRIRTRDKLAVPGVPEKHVQMRNYRERGVKPLGLLADFSKAHRRIKIVEGNAPPGSTR